MPAMGDGLMGLKVLLIDDDESVRQAMAELLSDWGCWCEVAESASAASALLQRFEPEVLVCDHRLRDGRSGVQAVEQVWARAQRRVPAVLVTADTTTERLREAHASGLLLLHKPVPARRLQEVLLHLSGRRVQASPSGVASA
jgi:CheY-like chemotaxis protein